MTAGVSANTWLIRDGRLIDPAWEIDQLGDLAVRDGAIAESAGREAPVFDAHGLIVAPGLWDLHVHLREPGGAHKETIATGTAAAVAGGFTTVACMPNTTPALDTPERIAWVRERARTGGACRVLPVAAVTLGRLGGELVDFAALHEAGAVAFSDDGDGIADDRLMEAALEQVRRVGSVLIQHCEDQRLSGGGVMQAGPTAQKLGLRGQDPRAEAAMLERDLALVRRTGARYHAAHVSTAAAVDLVRRAKVDRLPVTAEVCPHHLTLCEQDVLESAADPNFKMNPPLRSREDVQACLAGLLDSTMDCIVTDHAPHTPAEKSVGFAAAPFGVVGLETALSVIHGVLIESGRADWMTLIDRMSTGPARVLGLPAPTLAPGQPADLTLIDPQARWTVDPERFVSKSRNTPYRGWRMTGQVAATFVGGVLRYLHETAKPRLL
jgi:dihydroorotase